MRQRPEVKYYESDDAESDDDMAAEMLSARDKVAIRPSKERECQLLTLCTIGAKPRASRWKAIAQGEDIPFRTAADGASLPDL